MKFDTQIAQDILSDIIQNPNYRELMKGLIRDKVKVEPLPRATGFTANLLFDDGVYRSCIFYKSYKGWKVMIDIDHEADGFVYKGFIEINQ
jgi:hypothetical protein